VAKNNEDKKQGSDSDGEEAVLSGSATGRRAIALTF